ncbi:MAG: S26 family signal peptidase [Nitrospirota bacterium]
MAWWRSPALRWPVLAVTTLLWIMILASPWVGLAIRSDESWPHHRLFLIVKARSPARGEFAAFSMTAELAARVQPPRDRPYARVGALWMKRVVGIEGDRITLLPMNGGQTMILINGQRTGVALSHDRTGQPIQVAALPAVIPPGYVYVSLDHPRSFDSRYFGLVPMAAILGTAKTVL